MPQVIYPVLINENGEEVPILIKTNEKCIIDDNGINLSTKLNDKIDKSVYDINYSIADSEIDLNNINNGVTVIQSNANIVNAPEDELVDSLVFQPKKEFGWQLLGSNNSLWFRKCYWDGTFQSWKELVTKDSLKQTKHLSNVSLLEIAESGTYYIDNASDSPSPVNSGYLTVAQTSNTNYRQLTWQPFNSNDRYINTKYTDYWTGWTKLSNNAISIGIYDTTGSFSDIILSLQNNGTLNKYNLLTFGCSLNVREMPTLNNESLGNFNVLLYKECENWNAIASSTYKNEIWFNSIHISGKGTESEPYIIDKIYNWNRIISYENLNNYIENENLLINPDFLINQREETEYIGGGDYTVDRWVDVGSAENKVTVEPSGSVVHTNSSQYGGLLQYIENPAKLAGKTVTYTLDYQLLSGQYYLQLYDTGTGTLYGYTGISEIGKGHVSMTVTLPDNIGTDRLYFGITSSGTEGENKIRLYYSKLELGSIATPFVPPEPATELIKCRRYYQTLNGQFRYYNGNTQHVATFTLRYNVSMRVTPTIIDKSSVLGNIDEYDFIEKSENKVVLQYKTSASAGIVHMYYTLNLNAEIY